MIVEVALSLPIRRTFDYRWPQSFSEEPRLGLRVIVPFGPHKKSGILVRVKKHSLFKNLKKVESLLEETPLFSQELLTLTEWVATYYFCAWGEVLHSAIPGGLGIQTQPLYLRNLPTTLSDLASASPQLQQFVEQNQEWTQKDWQKIKPTQKDRNLLQHWINSKEIEVSQSVIGSKHKIKSERWVRLIAPLPPLKTSRRKLPKWAQITELLAIQQELSVAEIKNFVPTPAQALKKLVEERVIEIFQKRVYRKFLVGGLPPIEPFPELQPGQKAVLEKIQPILIAKQYHTFLLQGVTGSGKTEVYLNAVHTALAEGRGSLVLVPEISLTPQLVNRFRSRFGDQVGILHSGMDDGERFDEWSKIWKGDIPIVIGARSAVFAPVKNLGLIIVDEEHDPSYKQGETPRYQGRNVAVYRGYMNQATVILGSATPSLESRYNVAQGKYTLLEMNQRIHQVNMPTIELLDLKEIPRQQGSYFFSEKLVKAIRDRLQRKEQSLLFLNRRGYSPLLQCQDCEYVFTCKDCSLSLVYHQSIGALKCHQCDFSMPLPRKCTHCGSTHLKEMGVGTEQIESELKMMFPHASLLRLDRDTLQGKHALEKKLEQIANQEVDIVIGTQIVTKGHDFPNITLVGVMLADLSLNIPDFRASERTFQLLTQVAGRAGRGKKGGEVLIQTYHPMHHSLSCTQHHDYELFLQTELQSRAQLKAVPYSFLVLLIFSSPKEERAEALAHEFASNVRHHHQIPVIGVGPAQAPIAKIKNRFRWMMMLKATHISYLHQLLALALETPSKLSLQKEERITVDIDPYQLL